MRLLVDRRRRPPSTRAARPPRTAARGGASDPWRPCGATCGPCCPPDGSVVPEPGDHHHRQVEQGHAGQQHRREHARCRRPHRQVQLEDERGDQEPQQHRPRVAQEDPGGWEVVAQEPQGGARGGERERRHQEVAVVAGDRGDAQRRGGGHAGGDPVHVVDEVERIGDGDHPQDRERQVDPRGVEHAGSDAHGPQRDRRRALVTQTDPRIHVVDVVEQAHDREDERAGQYHKQLAVRAGGEQADHDQPGRHGHAAEVGRGARVGLVAPRVIEHVPASGEPAGQRRQQQGSDQRHHERHRVADPSRDAFPRERVARDEDGGPGAHGLRHRTPVLHRDRTAMMPALPWFLAPRRVACRHE